VISRTFLPILVSILWALLGTGCLIPQASSTTSYAFPQSPMQPVSSPEPASEGSLWSPRRTPSLVSDVKARNVGDIVTINVVESATASKNATTKTSKQSDLAAGWTGVLKKISGDWIGGEVKADMANNFDGKGETTRSSQLAAYITAQVIQVLPNGYLVIHGSRHVRVNNENQIINVQGVIRTEDINSSNIVLSTYIADARIELIGEGVISDKQRPGWMARVLDWVWPF
jgi:flagellar L-ring protein FlgH